MSPGSVRRAGAENEGWKGDRAAPMRGGRAGIRSSGEAAVRRVPVPVGSPAQAGAGSDPSGSGGARGQRPGPVKVYWPLTLIVAGQRPLRMPLPEILLMEAPEKVTAIEPPLKEPAVPARVPP
ncbi:hypothetical protein EDD29_4667 [Actinocorallia herbida]|uniref:Uncharacterized protein n=1 Tax=Actinocorallia herbida TaxID=58109 RepID=A0A3N1D1Y6_9ACTN|nr:hypothetical protein EDD29_4667 [Actinocorallia herbida]